MWTCLYSQVEKPCPESVTVLPLPCDTPLVRLGQIDFHRAQATRRGLCWMNAAMYFRLGCRYREEPASWTRFRLPSWIQGGSK